ncbi:MAG: helix-turn-helix transcriptional regulator [Slackia piriformis]|uniref:Helix-turn-helix transcriptional regulator n=1 Tax=Slackia piriformis TaxID=626934 RepID=A0A943UUW6_9ACTN|nr:helix-turn-helix transcriptional regulator [Slackia piriformis]
MYSLKLREIRKAKKITQGELAMKIGVSERIVGGWERGETGLPLDDAYRCALALGCTPNDLCGWYDEHPRQEAPASLPPEESELMRNYRACSLQWKHTISMTARAAAGESREETERAAYADAVSEAV